MLLFPLGFLLPFVVERMVKARKAFFVGALVSAVIELCQLIFGRGLFEWDDMIDNGLGCMLGSILCCRMLKLMKWKGQNRKS